MLVVSRNRYCLEDRAGLTGGGASRYRFKAGAGIRGLCLHLLFESFTGVTSLLALSSPYLYRTFACALKEEDALITTFFDECHHTVMRLPFGNGAVNIFRLFHQSGLKVSSENGKVVLQRFWEICASIANRGMRGLSPLRVGRLFRRSHFQGEDSSGDVYPFGPSTHCATAAEQRIIDGSYYGLSGF